MRNDYGQQVGKLVGKRNNQGMAKIQAAMDAVAKLKSNPTDLRRPPTARRLPAESCRRRSDGRLARSQGRKTATLSSQTCS